MFGIFFSSSLLSFACRRRPAVIVAAIGCSFISLKSIHNIQRTCMEILRVKCCWRTGRCSCSPHRSHACDTGFYILLLPFGCCGCSARPVVFQWIREICRQLYCAKNSTSFTRCFSSFDILPIVVGPSITHTHTRTLTHHACGADAIAVS